MADSSLAPGDIPASETYESSFEDARRASLPDVCFAVSSVLRTSLRLIAVAVLLVLFSTACVALAPASAATTVGAYVGRGAYADVRADVATQPRAAVPTKAAPSPGLTGTSPPLPRRSTERPWWPYAILGVLVLGLIGIAIALITAKPRRRQRRETQPTDDTRESSDPAQPSETTPPTTP